MLKRKTKKIDSPEPIFKDWAYLIGDYHYHEFGIEYRQFFKNKIPYMSWCTFDPPEYSFLEGSVYHSSVNKGETIQTITDSSIGYISIIHSYWDYHESPTQPNYFYRKLGYEMPAQALAEFLRTGSLPKTARRIRRGEGSNSLLSYRIENPDDNS